MGRTHPECEGLGSGRCRHKYPHDGGGGHAGSPRSSGDGFEGGSGCLLFIAGLWAVGVLVGVGLACVA